MGEREEEEEVEEEEVEEEEGLPALYLGKQSLWTLQQEIGRLKNGF